MDNELYYDLRHLSSDKFADALDELWEELKANKEMRAEALSLGVSADTLDRSRRLDLITIRREAAGFDFTPIVIAFSPVAAKILKDIWNKILLPKLEQKKGKDVIKPTKTRHR